MNLPEYERVGTNFGDPWGWSKMEKKGKSKLTGGLDALLSLIRIILFIE